MNQIASGNGAGAFKAVLIFHLKDGQADEELRRSREPESFPSRLARQPGFINLELVKLDDANTMSLQTWQSAAHWWAALETVRNMPPADTAREDILMSRDFFGGEVMVNYAQN